MRGANSLQRHVHALAVRHGVTLPALRRVPLTPPPDHDTIVLEGIASSPTLDRDRTRFVPFCFGTSLPTSLPLLIEHDPSRPAGTAALSYDATGALRVRTSPVTGDAARFSAFSIGARILNYQIHDADRPDFHAAVTAAELTEISLTEYPHLSSARVVNRMRPAARAEFFDLMARRVGILSNLAALMLTMQKEARG